MINKILLMNIMVIKRILLSMVVLLSSVALCAQDVVYLKNGSIIKGNVTELVPDDSVKIQTTDGSLFVYKMSEVEKIGKDSTSDKSGDGVKSGYRGFIDVAYLLGDCNIIDDCHRLEVTTSHGYQFNPYIYAGLGVGFNVYKDFGLGTLGVFPVFAHFRYDILNRRITPFYECTIGYSFGDIEDIYASTALGCRFGLANNKAINVSVNYSSQAFDFTDGQYIYSTNMGGLGLKIGFEF